PQGRFQSATSFFSCKNRGRGSFFAFKYQKRKGEWQLVALLEDVRECLNDWTELWFNDSKRTGYVALTDFKKQLFYGANDVKRIIDITQGRERQYISINSFKGWNDGISPNRETANLKQIRN